MDELYELLGVAPDAEEAELRRAWREVAKRWHPDHAGSDTTFIFQKLLAAYDAALERARTRPPPEAPAVRRAPGVMIRRLSGPLNALLARGVVQTGADGVLELLLEEEEVREGGMITISMRVATEQSPDELFAAWLAVRPGVADGTQLTPSAQLPGVLQPVVFRVRCPRA